MTVSTGKASLVAGASTAIVSSLCCLGPVVLLSLGIGSSWAGNLSVLESYRPIFIGFALVFLAFALQKAHSQPVGCKPGTSCADSRPLNHRKWIYWLISILAVTIMTMPWLITLNC